MTQDINGNPINVGDQVILTGHVVATKESAPGSFPGTGAANNIEVQLDPFPGKSADWFPCFVGPAEVFSKLASAAPDSGAGSAPVVDPSTIPATDDGAQQ